MRGATSGSGLNTHPGVPTETQYVLPVALVPSQTIVVCAVDGKLDGEGSASPKPLIVAASAFESVPLPVAAQKTDESISCSPTTSLVLIPKLPRSKLLSRFGEM